MMVHRQIIRRILDLGAFAFVVASVSPEAVHAQSVNVRRVTVLPILSSSADSLLAAEYYDRLMPGFRTGNWLRIARGDSLPAGRNLPALRRSLRTLAGLRELSTTTGSSFVIGGVLTRPPGGGVAITSVVYGRDDIAVLALASRTYPDEAAARAGAVELSAALSRPSNFTTPDAAFFYSMIIPGAGQASMHKWGWAAFSAVAVTGAAIYRYSLPSGDPYLFDIFDFRSERLPGSSQYHYYVENVEVDRATYDQMLRAAQAHGTYAKLDRLLAGDRKKEANLILLTAWLFNIVNTLLLGQHQVDAAPFFEQVYGLESTGTGISPTVGIRLRLPIDP